MNQQTRMWSPDDCTLCCRSNNLNVEGVWGFREDGVLVGPNKFCQMTQEGGVGASQQERRAADLDWRYYWAIWEEYFEKPLNLIDFCALCGGGKVVRLCISFWRGLQIIKKLHRAKVPGMEESHSVIQKVNVIWLSWLTSLFQCCNMAVLQLLEYHTAHPPGEIFCQNAGKEASINCRIDTGGLMQMSS